MGFSLWGENVAPPDPPSLETPSNNSPNIAGSASSEADATIQKRRGRKPLSDSEKRERELQKEKASMLTSFDALFTPETWEGIMSAPADMALAVTGSKEWDLSERERKTLGSTAAMTAKCFAVTDPKWLAVSMLCITVMEVYGTRATIAYMRKVNAKKNKAPEQSDGQ